MKKFFLILVLFVFSLPSIVSAAETSTLNFVIQSRDMQTNEVAMLSVSQQLSKPFNITLIDFATKEPVKSFILTTGTHSENLTEGKYLIFIEQGTEELLLDNNGTGYTTSDTIVIPQYCVPSIITCYLEDQYYMDMPWRVEPGQNVPVFGVINNDAVVNVGIKYVRIYDTKHTSDTTDDTIIDQISYSPSLSISLSQLPYSFTLSANPSLLTTVGGKAEVRLGFGIDAFIDYDNDEGPMEVLIASDNLPQLSDWYAGDTHFHSEYTKNAVELGASMETINPASKAIGLDWVTVTDHSFDLDSTKWSSLGSECNSISDSSFKCIRGEEISVYLPGTNNPICVGEYDYRYNHYLAYGTSNLIVGGECEDGTTGGFTPSEVVSMVNGQGGFGYAAHPRAGSETDIRDKWQDYSLPFTGLQIWNYDDYVSDPQQLQDGLAKWRELLASERHIFIEGGSDAHGDFNERFGKVRTYVYVPDYSQTNVPPQNKILNALKNGHSVMTDGPLVTFTINGEIIGNTVTVPYGASPVLNIQWKSTPEFNEVRNIKIYRGDSNGETKIFDSVPALLSGFSGDYYAGTGSFNGAPGGIDQDVYFRIEAETRYYNPTFGIWITSHRAYTNPIWVEVLPSDTTPPTTPSLLTPSNGYSTNNPAISFSWTAASDSDSGVKDYQIQIDNNNDFSSPERDVYVASTSYSTSLSDNVYYWRVRARDSANNLGLWTSSWSFTLDSTPPSVTIVSPNGGESWQAGTSQLIRWSATDNIGVTEAKKL